MTVKEWLQQASNQLSQADIASAELDSRLILQHVTGRSHEQIIAHPDSDMSADQVKAADKLLKARSGRLPMSQILGGRNFYGLEIEVTADVLTPRIETETMVDFVIKKAPNDAKLLDVGTGSGVIAIAIARHRPDLKITATDVSSAALKVAGRNAKQHQVRIKLVQSDLFDQIKGRFDIITANLPYLRSDADLMPEVRNEPRVALIGGTDGLDLYRRFFDQLNDHLKFDGLVMIEADPWQHSELKAMAMKAGLKISFEDYFILGFTAAGLLPG